MNKELLTSLEYIEKEKGVHKEIILDALKQALLLACKKTYSETEEFEVRIDPETARIRVLRNGKEIQDAEFGRIAAQTAKQVIIQKIREAERKSIFDDFIKKQGDLISGSVHRFEKRAIIVDLGKTEGILPAREQSPADEFRQGDYVKALVLEVKKTPGGPEIILSRANEGMVKRLFEIEVPEIHEGIVQIKAIAREAGSRTKIAVYSSDSKVDPVGSCVGMRGQRVKNIVRELRGEKIDIIRWQEDIETYIRESLKPAEISEVKLERKEKSAEIFVADDQLSLAIGKRGQNIRLASKLLGWKLDVRSKSQKIPISSLDGVDDKVMQILNGAGIQFLKDILKSTVEDLSKIEGLDEKVAERIFRSAHQKILEGQKSNPLDFILPAASEKKADTRETPADEGESNEGA